VIGSGKDTAGSSPAWKSGGFEMTGFVVAMVVSSSDFWEICWAVSGRTFPERVALESGYASD
jgi:hypothetical protein